MKYESGDIVVTEGEGVWNGPRLVNKSLGRIIVTDDLNKFKYLVDFSLEREETPTAMENPDIHQDSEDLAWFRERHIVKRAFCDRCNVRNVYHDKKSMWICPFCEL